MNPQLEIFIQNQSPRKMLDQKLTPIFNHIRARNIHCVSQLQQEKIEDLNELQPQIKTLSVFYNKKVKIQKQDLSAVQKMYVPQVKTVSRKKIHTVEYGPLEKIMYVSPNSKVKKHLVDNINYNGIEEALFKHKKRVNRFDEFCKTLREKERWLSLKPSSLQRFTEQEFRNTTFDPFSTVQESRKNPFRVTRKERSPNERKLQHLIKKQPLSRHSQI